MGHDSPRDVGLVSVLIDLGAGRRGVDMGPSALRIAGVTEAIEAIGHNLIELGSVAAGGFETTDPGDGTVRFLDEILVIAARTRGIVFQGLQDACFPVILGGDHSLSIGSVGAVADHYRRQGERIGLIWVDAHTDMNRPDTSPSGNIHGMSLAVLMGHGHPKLVALAGDEPAVQHRNVVVFGARDVDQGEKDFIHEHGIRVFTMAEIDDRGVSACMKEALGRATDGTVGFHMSFDLDALDPRLAPGVGTPVQGGLTYRESHLVCEKAARSGHLLSFDLVELNPVMDIRNITANLAVGIIASALGQSIL